MRFVVTPVKVFGAPCFTTDRALRISLRAKSWFERWRRRQYELAQGGDADLVRDNRKRYRLAFSLLGFAILLSLLVSKVDLGKQLSLVMSVVAAGSGVAALLLLMWARQEQVLLHKPDPEVPPKIFR